MVGVYSIKVGDASAKSFVSLAYEFTLNAISNSQVAIDGVTGPYFDEFDVDKEVLIYKNGTLTFKGTVINQNSLSAGGIILTCIGIEQELTESKCPMSGSTTRAFVATTDNSIISTLVTSVSGWTVDVSNSSAITLDSFRVSASESVWNGVVRLIEDTGKDFRIDQENKKVYLYDELTRISKFSFIEGKNCTGISRSKGRTKAAKVIVYGKGDGDSQITGTFGSGVPVATLIDRNIISTAEANRRAENEYNKLNPQPKTYNINPYIIPTDLNIGDSGNISNNSANIDEEVDLVRLKVTVDKNGNEKFDMEVTNPDFRIASKNSAEDNAKARFQYSNSQSSMQGSGNTNTWGSGINAKTSYPLKVGFYLPASYIQDEAGNSNVKELTVSYDIDKYKNQFGTASYDGSDPQVQNLSGEEGASVSGTSGAEGALVSGTSATTQPDLDRGDSSLSWSGSSVGSDIDSSVSCSSGAWTTVCAVNTAGSDDELYANFYITGNSGGAEDLQIRIQNTGTLTFNNAVWGNYTDGFRDTSFIQSSGESVGPDGSSDQIRLQVYPFTGAIVVAGYLSVYKASHEHSYGDYGAEYHGHADGSYAAASHDHADGSYAASDHDHPDGSYDINASDLDNISIGDDVGEAGSINASSVNLYLDFYNTGTSTWDNKHSILNTGATLDSDVDMTDGNTYPDAEGFWRIRVEPITATADFAQGIVKIKNSVDN